jgi:hypothetical protein
MPVKPILWGLGAFLVLALAAACGDNDAQPDGPVHREIDAEFIPIVISTDIAAGENRFLVGLIRQEDSSPVTGADLHFRFLQFEGNEATERFQADAEAITIPRTFVHLHDDGTRHVHELGETGAYVAYVEFDQPGAWAVEVTGSVEGKELEPVRPTFSVLEAGQTLAVGDPAPRTDHPTLADVGDIALLDTSQEPIPQMHQMTIAEAVTSGRPSVIIFATPAFCQSQICGPTKDIVDELYHAYGDRANFVHIEPYDVQRMRNGECPSLFDCLAPAVREWGLRNEPWVFIVDANGNIAGKFEGIVSYDELERALAPLVS